MAAWVQRLAASGLAPATVRYAHRVLSLALAHAVRDGRMSRNPAEGVRLPRVVREEPVFLDHDQVARLADACGRYGLLVRFLAHTGLRWGEASALRGADYSRTGTAGGEVVDLGKWRSPGR